MDALEILGTAPKPPSAPATIVPIRTGKPGKKTEADCVPCPDGTSPGEDGDDCGCPAPAANVASAPAPALPTSSPVDIPTPPVTLPAPPATAMVASTPSPVCSLPVVGSADDVISVEAVEEEAPRPRRRRRRPAPKEEEISTPLLVGGALLLSWLIFGGNSGTPTGPQAGVRSTQPADPSIPPPQAESPAGDSEEIHETEDVPEEGEGIAGSRYQYDGFDDYNNDDSLSIM